MLTHQGWGPVGGFQTKINKNLNKNDTAAASDTPSISLALPSSYHLTFPYKNEMNVTLVTLLSGKSSTGSKGV